MKTNSTRDNPLYRAVAIAIVCVFLFNDAAFGLSPTSRFNPIITSSWNKATGQYEMTEDAAEKERWMKWRKEDAAFVYLNLLIGQFLHEMKRLTDAGMSKRGVARRLEELKLNRINALKDSIGRDLPQVNFSRFLYNEMYLEGDAVCLPYIRREDRDGAGAGERRQILRYRLPSDRQALFPDEVSIPLGDGTSVVLETLPGDRPRTSARRMAAAGKDARIADHTVKYREYLPDKLKPDAPPFRLLHITGKTFEALFALYGERGLDDFVVGQGPVDFFPATDERQFRRMTEYDMKFAAILAEAGHYNHQGVSYLDGAHCIIIGRPDADKADVLKEWADIFVESGILGEQYIASTGRGVSSTDLIHISKHVIRHGEHFDIPLTFSRDRKSSGLPWEEWNVQGVGPIAALLAVKAHPYSRERVFAGKDPAKIRTFIYGYGHVGSAFIKALIHNYSAEIGIEIFAVSDPDGAVYSPDSALSRNTLRQINMRIRKGLRHPLGHIQYDAGDRMAGTGDPELGRLYEAADCVVLASTPHSFRLATAERLRGKRKIVLEINPCVATKDARRYMNDPANGILFIPFSSANIGKAYAEREWLHAVLIGKNKYNTYTHIADGISGMTMANMWTLLSEWRRAVTQTFRGEPPTFEMAATRYNDMFRVSTFFYGGDLSKGMAGKDGVDMKYVARRTYLPDRIARRVAVFDQVYGEMTNKESTDSLVRQLESKEWQPRRVAAYKLGRKDYPPGEAERIIATLGKAMLADKSRYVKTEFMKAIGRIGHPSALEYIVGALSAYEADQATPQLLEWGLWSVERIRFVCGNDRVDSRLGELLQTANGNIAIGESELARAENQMTLKNLAEAQYRKAVIIHLLGRFDDAIAQYETAAGTFVRAQCEGGILPFGIEFSIADIYFKMGRMREAREALLKILFPTEARHILSGNYGENIGFEEVDKFYPIFRQHALTRLFIMDGLSTDIARSLASALVDYFRRRTVASIPADPASLDKAEAEFEREYEGAIRGTVATYIEDRKYEEFIKLLIRAGNGIYYNFPDISRRLLTQLSGEKISDRLGGSYRAPAAAAIPAAEQTAVGVLSPEVHAAGAVDTAAGHYDSAGAVDLKDGIIALADSSRAGAPKTIIALGTRCIPGYDTDEASPQRRDLNRLIISIRKFCESRGIPFIDRDDDMIQGAIAAQRAQEGFRDARVIVLAGVDAIEQKLAAMQGDENVFLVGIDNRNLAADRYVPIVEMLKIALELASDPSAKPASPNMELVRPGKFWILIPRAGIKDIDELHRMYEMQIFA